MIFLEIGLCLFSSLATFRLSRKFKNDSVFTSGGVTLAMILICSLFVSDEVLIYLGKLIFGASFVGMSSKDHFSIKAILVASLFFYLVFIFIYPMTPYQAGALGFSAFMSCLLSKLISTTKVYINFSSNKEI